MEKVGLFAYGEMGCSSLRSLVKKYKVIWVILPPLKMQTSAESYADDFAKKNKIKVFYKSSFFDIKELIKKDRPAAVVISSFNKVLPSDILELSKFLNVHLGDLPKMRGRATVNWAIINNLSKTVITIHEVAVKLDSGNIYAKFPIKIGKNESVGDVYVKINEKIEIILAEIVEKVLSGFEGKKQIGKATYYCTRLPNDGLINFDRKSNEVNDFIRALSKPYPGAFTFFRGKKMIVWDSFIPKVKKKYIGRIPGRVIEMHEEGVEVLTKDSSIIIGNVLFEGKEQNSSLLIKSIKTSLGIDFVTLYEKIMTQNES